MVKTMRAEVASGKRVTVEWRRGRRRMVRMWWPTWFVAKMDSMDCGERGGVCLC